MMPSDDLSRMVPDFNQGSFDSYGQQHEPTCLSPFTAEYVDRHCRYCGVKDPRPHPEDFDYVCTNCGSDRVMPSDETFIECLDCGTIEMRPELGQPS